MEFSPLTPLPSILSPGEVVRQVLGILRSEIEIVAQRRWEDLPELKRKKVALASRCRQLSRPEAISALQRTAILQLENESRQQVRGEMDHLGRQINALQDLRQYWAECLNVSFAKYF